MSSNLDQSFDSFQVEIGYDHSNEAAFEQTTLEPFKPFPDEILPLIFHQLSSFQRCLILSVCRNWNAILLAGRGFWQIVHLPLHLSISNAISVLQTFNLRSGFSLKEVVFEGMMDDIKDVDLIFEELRKSSATIRTLVLPQRAKFNTQTRRFSGSTLPCLQFLYSYDHRSEPHFISRMWKDLLRWGGSQRGVDNMSKEEGIAEPSLRHYVTDSLNRVKKEEKSWFKELQSLQVHCTRSLEDLHSILEASKSSLKELNLSLWGKGWKELEDIDLEPISMDNSRGMNFQVPFDASAAKALGRFLKFTGQVRVTGNLASSVCFEMKCLAQNSVHLYDEEENERTRGPSMTRDELKEKTDVLLKMDSSLPKLVLYTLYTQSGGTGSAFHLNYFLERIIVPSSSFSKQQHRSPNATQGQDPLLLPKLKVIELHDPIELDGTLLRNCLESRSRYYPMFQLRIMMRGNLVRESKWEGQKWMK